MGDELTIPNTVFFTDTPIEEINRYATNAYFRNLFVNRNGRNHTLLDTCQHGYVVQCSGISHSSRRLMSYNDGTSTYEAWSLTTGYFLVCAFIAIGILLFIKIVKDKNNRIKELEKELRQKTGNYSKHIV